MLTGLAATDVSPGERELDNIDHVFAQGVRPVGADIHLALPDLVDPVHLQAAQALTSIAAAEGLTVRISLTRGHHERLLEAMATSATEGERMVVLGPTPEHLPLVPLAVIGSPAQPSGVTYDPTTAVDLVLDHVGADLARITFIDASLQDRSPQRAHLETVARHRSIDLQVLPTPVDRELILQSVGSLAPSSGRHLVLASDDLIASQLVDDFADRHDVVIAGYNRSEPGASAFVTVDQHIGTLVRQAVDLLLTRTEPVPVPPTLIRAEHLV